MQRLKRVVKNSMKLSLLFTVTLAMRPSTSWSETPTEMAPDEKILKANESTPYGGVLVPEPKYRFYREMVERERYLEQHPEIIEPSGRLSDTAMAMSTGGIVVFAICLFLGCPKI
jgi:hypothetical protein